MRQVAALVFAMLGCCTKAVACGDAAEADFDFFIFLIVGLPSIYVLTYLGIAGFSIQTYRKDTMRQRNKMLVQGTCLKELPRMTGNNVVGLLVASIWTAFGAQFGVWLALFLVLALLGMLRSMLSLIH